ncbi:topoisomerase DNA-binding C4 zinc finger domain-containing protein [bacterium]|nr:topoisomerase DNA-binding C4 zinc finger domain-containing protein [bacterium]
MHQELTNTSNQLSKMAQQLTDSVHDNNVLKNDLTTTKTENQRLKENLTKINLEYNAVDELLKDPTIITNEVCPDCGGNLVLRENHKTHSKFLGCLNYPKCTYIKHIAQPQPVTLKTKVQKLQAENKSLHEEIVIQKNKFHADLEDAKQSLNQQYQLRVDD